MADFGKLLHQNFKKLAAAGCKHIQIDEPYFTPSSEDEVSAAVDVINMAIEGLPDDVHVMVHICQGNYAVGPDYDGQIGHRYFDTGRYKADLICKIDCDGFLIEHDMTPHYEKCLGNKQLGVGAVDVQRPERRNRRTGRGPDQSASLARARTDHHHQFLRLQSSAAAYRLRQASRDERGQGHPDREMQGSETSCRMNIPQMRRLERVHASEERLRLAEAASGIAHFRSGS